MEVATLEATGFVLEGSDMIVHKKKCIRVRVRRRFPFSSTLKRMSVLVEVRAGLTYAHLQIHDVIRCRLTRWED